MSSRALRRAQKQKEEEEHLKRLQEEAEASESTEEDDTPAAPQRSAFALLNDEDEEPSDEPQDESEEDSPAETPPENKPVPKTKSKKGKKKRKNKSQATAQKSTVDDIDAALEALTTTEQTPVHQTTSIDPTILDAYRLLSIDSQNLHAENEMKRLFGRAAMETHDEDEQQPNGGRRRNRQQMGGLAAALGRRQAAQGGRSNGLGLLGLRRNLFVQGKEEWPIGTAGGLGMEIADKHADGTVEYKFVHNSSYQQVQSDFETCVRSYDPERMIRLLQLNPYHISTLLQVSEIAKQERDHTTSGDLLERALFSLGRALHSTFAGNLAQGKARMDFRRPENREFWLAVSRYMTNLSMRATWRTVFEWAKLLLSLDPHNDPYRMCLVIDQYALRARQPQQLLDMAANPLIGESWKPLPNMQLSLGLAHVQAGNPSKGKQSLFTTANRSPWLLAALFQALNLDAPPGIWGTTPRTDWEKLMTELYATRAKDLWASPEAQSLLAEVAAAVTGAVSPSPPDQSRITLDDARHVLLADIPALIALLPRDATERLTSASDPLPPDDEIRSYTVQGHARLGGGSMQQASEMLTIMDEIGPLMPAMRALLAQEERGEVTEADLEQAMRESGLTRAELDRTMGRFQQLMNLLSRGRREEQDEEEIDE